MGGTFDPIHHGHLVAASEVQSRFALDEVVFVPTGQPYQKGPVSPAEDRYLMTVIATASNPDFTTSRVDIDRDGIARVLIDVDLNRHCFRVAVTDGNATPRPLTAPLQPGGSHAVRTFVPTARPGFAIVGSRSMRRAARLLAGTSTPPSTSGGTKTAPSMMTICEPSGMLMSHTATSTSPLVSRINASRPLLAVSTACPARSAARVCPATSDR